MTEARPQHDEPSSEVGTEPVEAAPTPRKRLPAAQRRALIVEAATQLISTNGYEGTSVAEIAAASGINKAVVYDHFASKREIHLEVLNTEAQAMMLAIGQAMLSETEPAKRVRAGVYAFFEVVNERPYSRVCIMPAAVPDQEIMAAQAEIARNGRTALGMVFSTILEGDHTQEELEQFASVVRGSMTEMSIWWDEHPEISYEEVAEHTFQQIWRGLRDFVAEDSRDI